LSSIVEIIVLADDDEDIPSGQRQFIKIRNYKVIQLFADGKKRQYALPAKHIEGVRTKLIQWVQATHDRIAAELMSQTAIEKPPLLTASETSSNFRGDSDILSLKDVLYLQYKMPERHSYERWEMVYSTTRHGVSINTFYTKVAHRAPSVIVVEDTRHHVFGCYATEPWERNVTNAREYYGSGESFLFKIKPVAKIFKWSKMNDYFMLSSKEFIAMGGGFSGGYGLWLDSDFDEGNSDTCDTFLNEPLASSEQFKVLRMEVWSIPIFYKKPTRRPD